jgi:signal transduction histidine kinase
MDMF